MIKVPAYVVFYHEADRYLCFQCFVDKEQAEVLRDIYKEAGLKALIANTEVTIDCDSLEECLSMPLVGVYFYTEESGKGSETKTFGVDQMLSYKGFDTRRLFSITEFGSGCKSDNKFTVFMHSKGDGHDIQDASELILNVAERFEELFEEEEGGDGDEV